MHQQMQEYKKELLPKLERELEEYKKQRLKEADKTVNKIVQKVSQEVLGKSLSMEEHHDLIINSLEKSRVEGVFD